MHASDETTFGFILLGLSLSQFTFFCVCLRPIPVFHDVTASLQLTQSLPRKCVKKTLKNMKKKKKWPMKRINEIHKWHFDWPSTRRNLLWGNFPLFLSQFHRKYARPSPAECCIWPAVGNNSQTYVKTCHCNWLCNCNA